MTLELLTDVSHDHVHKTPRIKLYHGDQAEFTDYDAVDLILTNPYTPLPAGLQSKPMIVSNFLERKSAVEAMVGGQLTEVARWESGALEQGVWVRNLDPGPSSASPLDLSFLGSETFAQGRGWWPLDLPLRLLSRFDGYWRDEFGIPHCTVLDPFMGRGTTGNACRLLGLGFIGIDIDRSRVELAQRYLGVPSHD